jgi:hypothetical protein
MSIASASPTSVGSEAKGEQVVEKVEESLDPLAAALVVEACLR